VAAQSIGLSVDADEFNVAGWVWTNRRMAGQGSETLSQAALLYYPLQTATAMFGVMGIRLFQASDYLSPHHRRIVDAFAAQISLAMERVHLAEQAEQAQLLRTRESLERALLNSVSHDMRTPLVSIIGALSSLLDTNIALAEANRQALLRGAWDEAERLNRFVGDLLDMTRLEAGELRINQEPCDLQDLIGCALTALDAQLQDRPIEIDLAQGLPLVTMDMVLMTQVLINLVENGVKYTPPGSPLALRARIEAEELILEVLDRGPGVPKEAEERIFEKFYRLPAPEGVSGTGLGLSICRGIVEAHRGRLSVHNREDGGLCVRCRLPLDLERNDD
jgi:two-component system sensor histidine kinase KdpD